MKRISRLTLAALLAMSAAPAMAGNGGMSLWDQFWYYLTGQDPVTVAPASNCDPAHPLTCSSGRQ